MRSRLEEIKERHSRGYSKLIEKQSLSPKRGSKLSPLKVALATQKEDFNTLDIPDDNLTTDEQKLIRELEQDARNEGLMQ